MEKVSIIVPMYNVEQYIEKCLNSLIKQTYKNIVIYAVSDGSPDNSAKLAKKISKNDDRIIVIEKENGGYGSVLEHVINLINTKYFLICDSDDWLADDAIEKLVKSAEKHHADIAIANYSLFCDGNIDSTLKIYNDNYILKSGTVYNDLTNFTFTSVSPHAKLYRTELAKTISFPKKVSYTDKLLYYVFLSNAKKAVYLDENLAFYYIDRPDNSVSQIKKYTKKTFDQEYTVFKSIYEQLNFKSNVINALLYNLFGSYLFTLKNVKNINDKQIRRECKKLLSVELCKFGKNRNFLYSFVKGNFIKSFLIKVRLYLLTCKMNNIFIKILY